MASFSTRPNGRQHVFFAFGGKRHTIRLGLVNRQQAEEFCRRLERLIATKTASLGYDPDQRMWLQSMAEGPHNVLARAGLTDSRGATDLQGLCDIYLRRLEAADKKPRTIRNARMVCHDLLVHFGGRKP